MEIVITGRRTEVPERFRQQVEEKLAKIAPARPARPPGGRRAVARKRNPRQSQTCRKVEITVEGQGAGDPCGGAAPRSP